MPTSSYQPDVQVHIAFNAGYSTPAASRTWTDVSAYVELDEGISITRGRADEFGETSPSQLNLTLDNTDGRFTALRAASPYYPNVKIGRPIKVTSTRVGGSASIRFLGYIDEWPVEWDGTDAYAKAQITATSRMARLGLDQPLRSIIEEEYLLDSPDAYYTLSEAEGATSAADFSGNSVSSLIVTGSGADVVFGTATGPGTDGLTAATFAGGKYLRADLSPTTPVVARLECFFSTSSTGFLVELTGAAMYDPVLLPPEFTGPSNITLALSVLATGNLRGYAFGSARVAVDSVNVVNDGATHHAEIVATNGGNTVLYVDGIAVDTDATANTLGDIDRVSVGASALSGAPFTGAIAHAAFAFSTASAGRVAAHADAGLAGFAGEAPAARIARYAAYAALPAAEIAADTGNSPMAHVDTTGQTAADMLHLVEATEGGVLFDGRDGTLQFRDRDSRYLATSAFTLSVATQQVESDMAPKVDRTGLVNDVTASTTDGTVTATATNQTSVDDYGRKTETLELATTDVNEPHSAAWWRVNTYSEPRVRVPSLSVDLLPLSGSLQDSVLAADIGTRFAVTGIPSQAASTSGDYFVEGYTETIGPESYVFSFNVSDATAYVQTFVLDSATRGVLDTNALAY